MLRMTRVGWFGWRDWAGDGLERLGGGRLVTRWSDCLVCVTQGTGLVSCAVFVDGALDVLDCLGGEIDVRCR